MKFECPDCKQIHEADESSCGKEIECPACKKHFRAETVKAPDLVAEESMSRLMKCPDCGKMISYRARQCPNCGYYDESKDSETTKMNDSNSKNTKESSCCGESVKKEGKSKIRWVLLCFGLAFIMAGFLVIAKGVQMQELTDGVSISTDYTTPAAILLCVGVFCAIAPFCKKR